MQLENLEDCMELPGLTAHHESPVINTRSRVSSWVIFCIIEQCQMCQKSCFHHTIYFNNNQLEARNE
ncbi:hypothetical protein J6590_087575 [Homalodisca vitripennis]|nr:hypothetical protein J6590_087575 [Homalodisca vitripennis]